MTRWSGDHTGRVYNDTDLGITAATNWTITYCAGIKQGRQRVLCMQLNYGGTTVTATSAGNIGDQNVLSAGLPTDWTPTVGNVAFGFNNTGTSDGAGLLTTAGQISLTSLSPNATIASGSAIVLTATYIV